MPPLAPGETPLIQKPQCFRLNLTRIMSSVEKTSTSRRSIAFDKLGQSRDRTSPSTTNQFHILDGFPATEDNDCLLSFGFAMAPLSVASCAATYAVGQSSLYMIPVTKFKRLYLCSIMTHGCSSGLAQRSVVGQNMGWIDGDCRRT